MAPKTWLRLMLIVLLGLSIGYEVAAKEPIFVRWLVADDPGDATILVYWERYTRDELSPADKVDLGTMLFYRGYPKDAVGVFHSALDDDKKLYEAWFRIGLVEHQQGNLRKARVAYKKCLGILKGHGWCNFYLGLLEEQEGNAQAAMEYYSQAFRVAPELANPDVNPEIASSDLSLGAWLKMSHQQAFKKDLPMPFLEPGTVKETQSTAVALIHGEAVQGGEEETSSGGDKASPEQAGQAAGRAAPAVQAPPGSGPQPLRPASTSRPDTSSKGTVSTDKGQTNQEQKPGPRDEPGGPSSKYENDVPYGGPTESDDVPYGLPSTRSVSPEAYPGF